MRNPNAQHINFEFMKGIIPDNHLWLASNLDMCCERKGQFLFAEWKRIYEEIPVGQEKLLKALSLNPNCHVFIIDGYSDETGTEVNRVTRWYKGKKVVQGNSIEDLKRILVDFYKYADKLPVVPEKV
jgi:hypothetical protein